MKRLLAAVLLLIGLQSFATSAGTEDQVPDLLEVVTINGGIDSMSASILADQVDKINANKKIKAVLLVVDSPGGGVVASSIMYEELTRLKVPVVGWCQYVCASGGMYILMAPSVKYIAIRPDTITGSIGVIMHMQRYHRLLDWAKIDSETYKSGSLKDAGNGARPGEEAERKYLQGIVNSMASKFYSIVGASRKIKDWEAVKSARIFVGDEGVKVGLVDKVMTKEEVIKKAKEVSGSKNIYTREEMGRMSSMVNGNAQYKAPQPSDLQAYSDAVKFITDSLKEIKSGESVVFEYRMPLKF